MAKKLSNHRTTHKLLAFFILLLACFNYPLMAIFNHPRTLFDVPILYIYIFSIWLGSIIILASIQNHNSK